MQFQLEQSQWWTPGELAEYFLDRGETLANLRGVRTFGDVVEPHVRAVRKGTWGGGGIVS